MSKKKPTIINPTIEQNLQLTPLFDQVAALDSLIKSLNYSRFIANKNAWNLLYAYYPQAKNKPAQRNFKDGSIEYFQDRKISNKPKKQKRL